MRTTLEIPDDLLMAAKRVALERRSTLREVVTEGLRFVIESEMRNQTKNVFDSPVHISPENPLPALSNEEISTLFEQEDLDHLREVHSRR